jgi:hyperosmotically inducible periplasmic protein
VRSRRTLGFDRALSSEFETARLLLGSRKHEVRRMSKKLILLAALVVAAAGCDKAQADADNTKRNENDDKSGVLTAGDQGESEGDRKITQHVRQGVMGDDTLSMTAKNVKIITVNGIVTLRGPVNTEKEKTDIAAVAQRVEGVKRVDNQLEVKVN